MEPAAPLKFFSPEFVLTLLCPETKKPFVRPQAVNCPREDAFSLTTVTALFGAMQSNGLCERQGPCPVCKSLVTAYYPNLALQRAAELLIRENPDQSTLIIYPLGPCNFYLDTGSSRDQKKRISKVYTEVLLSDVNANEGNINFSGKKGPQAPIPNRITSIDIEIGGTKNPDFSITIRLFASPLKDKEKLLECFRANGITSFTLDEKGYCIESTSSFTAADFTRFLHLLKQTNKLRDDAAIQINKLIDRFGKA